MKSEGSIDLRSENCREKVFLVTEEGPNGDEVEPKPVDTKTYDESQKVASLDRASKVAKPITPGLMH